MTSHGRTLPPPVAGENGSELQKVVAGVVFFRGSRDGPTGTRRARLSSAFSAWPSSADADHCPKAIRFAFHDESPVVSQRRHQ
jgi:hypothetical protein